jgi:hypothetical protein
MSSENKQPKKRHGRPKKSAGSTSKRTPASPKRSPPPSPLELLSKLSKVLQKLKLRWYLFGAQAVNVYGIPRMTADVDVTIDVLLRS